MSQITTTGEKQNRFVFIAPMYNASDTLPQMLHSIFGQSYTNWHLVLIDDVSSPEQLKKAEQIVDKFVYLNNWDGNFAARHINMVDSSGERVMRSSSVTFIKNATKKWEVANVLRGIVECKDDDIICRIDADDWLTELDGLQYLNALYVQVNADCLWTAHRWGFTDKNISGPMPSDADPYKHPWVSSHLKTFRKRLINEVPYENFTNMNGDLVRRAGDQSLYLPVLYNAKRRGFVPRVMYHYTIDEHGGAVYQTDDAKFQKAEADFLRNRGYIAHGKPWEEVIQATSH